jgi:hypothetical protein
MIIHKECKQRIYLDMSAIMLFVTSFSVSEEGLIPACGDYIINKKTSAKGIKAPAKFFCKTCKESVEQKDLGIICDQCGKLIPIESSYKATECGGYYCYDCAGENDIKIAPLLPKIQTVSFIPNGRY